ncbi:hypothetical protein [Mycoplasmopsis agalactiae]|uniref:hypothetical protein n=1 Tax=Mycoplasmopsis agalactiae TaxID=2110 RepID=UPI000316AC05|nr:hypothetical protein [Mycoplasmopsis agalactiae]KAB6718605.1 hypothetical protein E4L58_01710 [Mycoplasmopsis agalactiae]
MVPYISYWDKQKKRPAKKSLPYIGSIVEINGEFVYVEDPKRAREDTTPIKTYGNCKFLDNLAKDIRDDLVRFFGQDTGLKKYAYSLVGILFKIDMNDFKIIIIIVLFLKIILISLFLRIVLQTL